MEDPLGKVYVLFNHKNQNPINNQVIDLTYIRP